MSRSVLSPKRRPLRWVGSLTSAAVISASVVVGVAAPAVAAPLSFSGTLGVTGSRPSATQLDFAITDQTTVSVDVATGNLLVTTSSLTLRGVNGDVPISYAYNSLGALPGSSTNALANDWFLSVDGAGHLRTGTSGAMVYVTAEGATWQFSPVSGQTGVYTSPAGFKSDLAGSGTGWTLTDRTSRRVITFNADGLASQVTDRNGNATTITNNYTTPAQVVSSAGPVAARTAQFSFSSSTGELGISQTSGSSTRSVKYVKDSSANLVSIVDALGKTTTMTYSSGRLATITAPTNQVTTFTYTTAGKVEKVAQANTSTGSPGTSTTRFAYPSTTQTLVADPNTDQALAVTAVPRTTYNFNATSKLVTSTTDEVGRSRGATYTPNADVASSTKGTGATAGTSTAAYGANNGESRTGATGPGGATSSSTYGNTAAATKYLPSSTTDDAANSSTFTYNGAGNQLSSTNALAATATLTYNTDGTIATALAPGNGTNKTVYAYNGNKQLSTVTPVTGSSLGVRTFTYDDFGRTRTATNGRGVTVTYGYDAQDRVLTTAFSDGTPIVVNAYTDGGQIHTREDAHGTTSYGYDQLRRLTSRQNSFGGGLISYSYDRASNLTKIVDARGTTTNVFDASGVPSEVKYQRGDGTTQTLGFMVDNQGRRTDTYLQTNAARTLWAAHTHSDYDTTGRVTRVIGQEGPATSPTTAMDVTYCYNAATPAPNCGTGTGTDRSKLQWERNNLTGQVTAYTYDTGGHLTQAAQSGGTSNNTWAYTYDARGNRLTANVTGATPSSQTFTVNPGNQITTARYTFDGAGNLTADPTGTYAYTGADQMKSVTKAGTTYNYKYAGASQNEVLKQEKSGDDFELVYGRPDQQGQPVVEQARIGTVTAYVENDPVTGDPLLLRTSTGTVSLYVYSGNNGSPIGLLTDQQATGFAYAYDPFGVPTVTANSGGTGLPQKPYLFQGGLQDRATGWVKYGARWYNPTIGRWTQQDTLDAPLDPNNANRYSFAAGDPINNTDPTGLASSACSSAQFAFGGAVASIALTGVAGIVTAPTGVGAALAVGAIYVEIAAASSAAYAIDDACR